MANLPDGPSGSTPMARRDCLRVIGCWSGGLALSGLGIGRPLLLAPEGGGAPGAGGKAAPRSSLRGIEPWTEDDQVVANYRVETHRRAALGPLVAAKELADDRI